MRARSARAPRAGGHQSGGPFTAVTVDGAGARAVVCRAHARRLAAGHFPGDPLLPGAYLAELMATLALAAAGSRAVAVAELVRCTLRARVRPDDEIVVVARRRAGAAADTVDAEIHANGTPAARAVVRLRARG